MLSFAVGTDSQHFTAVPGTDSLVDLVEMEALNSPSQVELSERDDFCNNSSSLQRQESQSEWRVYDHHPGLLNNGLTQQGPQLLSQNFTQPALRTSNLEETAIRRAVEGVLEERNGRARAITRLISVRLVEDSANTPIETTRT